MTTSSGDASSASFGKSSIISTPACVVVRGDDGFAAGGGGWSRFVHACSVASASRICRRRSVTARWYNGGVVRFGGFAIIGGLIAFAACAHSHGESTPSAAGLPPLAAAKTTVDQTIVPRLARASAPTAEDPAQPPSSLSDLLAQGYGDTLVGPGDPIVPQVSDGTTPPAPGPNAKRLLRFAHLADLQIADDESPTRLAKFDTSTITNSALRPSDEYLCRMTNAAVRTINALHRQDAFAFTLMGGDIADSAQTNEIDWALGMLSGSPYVKCDSGAVDDPIPGPSNDGKDAFAAEGLAMPWKWVTGNHDVLVQGNFTVPQRVEAVLGSAADGGTRDYAKGDNGAIEGSAIPDPKRALLTRNALMAKVAADKDGHGLGQNEIQSGRATYTFDIDGTPLRFLILDTAHENGDSEGVITQRQVDGQIRGLARPGEDRRQMGRLGLASRRFEFDQRRRPRRHGRARRAHDRSVDNPLGQLRQRALQHGRALAPQSRASRRAEEPARLLGSR